MPNAPCKQRERERKTQTYIIKIMDITAYFLSLYPEESGGGEDSVSPTLRLFFRARLSPLCTVSFFPLTASHEIRCIFRRIIFGKKSEETISQANGCREPGPAIGRALRAS